MEPAEMISEQWCSLSGLYTAKEADFMSQLLGNCLVPEQLYQNSNFGIDSAFWPTAHESSIVSVQGGDLDSKHINEIENNTDLVDTGKDDVPDDKMAPKERENEIILVSEQERNREITGKRSRSSNEVPKNKWNVKSKKNMRYVASQDETLSSICCSDDDSNASQNDSTALKSSRKSRGSATDPQSVYARRRRERINERLRILQNIVPNGTKVDISTMLEEAIQYVKFLQLQIKLLSSDDMWMYAPIAYNGMNIGLQLSITPTTKEPKEVMMHGIGIAIKENASD